MYPFAVFYFVQLRTLHQSEYSLQFVKGDYRTSRDDVTNNNVKNWIEATITGN